MPVPFFRHPDTASADGLLGWGGDLSPLTLIQAYHCGIFPWYAEGQPILWWSPDPRCVLFPEKIRVSKSMRLLLAKKPFRFTVDRAFSLVMEACRIQKRRDQHGTWITDEMTKAYLQIHRMGVAHSVEVWQDDDLVGGLYGLALGRVFFGESMFTKVSNASKAGFIFLVKNLRERNFQLIDCQQDTAHLRSLGAELISRRMFLDFLRKNSLSDDNRGSWISWNLNNE